MNHTTVDRLFDGFKPSHYTLHLTPDKEQMTFTGTVEIKGTQVKASNIIKLHAKGLRIDESSFSIGGGVHSFVNHKHGDDDVLYLATPLQVEGDMTVTLKFYGEITEPMVGIYPCLFEHDGKQKRIIATQFESHHAREVFPCIDEPSAKATFDVTLTTPPHEVVLFNTEPASSKKETTGWTTTAFVRTPVMSTYLLAFVVGELESVEAKTAGGTTTRIWVTPGNVAMTAFALDMAVKSLDKLEAFFGIPFPMAKIDHVGLPDFAAGAMENWGLITYREVALLVDEKNSSLDDIQWSAAVIAHELAHQWFGNLVTMGWWTDLWLNEGFASWMEKYIPDQLFPEWRLWEQFVTGDFHAAQGLDALEHSHPIEVAVDNPDDIRSIFDAISYDKGASIIRMLHEYLGDEVFRRGIRAYMNKHQYNNATTADLWAALEETSKKPVKEFMHAWTSQTGFPLVSATVGADEIALNQQRYVINPAARETLNGQLWPIPITSTHTSETLSLSDQASAWSVTDSQKAKINVNQTGFYMVKYDSEHIQRLATQVRDGALEPLDRLGMLHDAFQLAKGGYSSTIDALALLDAYNQESDAGVWDVIASQLSSIRAVFGTDALRDAMKPYLLDLSKRQLARLGWDEKSSDSHFDKLLRPTILSLASIAEEPSVLNEIHVRFSRMQKPEDIHPDLRGVIFGTTARVGGAAEYEMFLKLYRQATLPQVKLQFAGALCSFKDEALIARSIELMTSKEVRLQEVAYWIGGLFSNRYAKTASWNWLTQNWNWIVDKFGTDIMTFSYFPKIAGRSFATKDMQAAYAAFFNEAYTSGIDRPIAQGLEALQWQTAWRERDETAINEYFTTWKPRPAVEQESPPATQAPSKE